MARWGCEKDVLIRVMAILGSWDHLGPSWGLLGVILASSWSILGHLGPSWGHPGPILAYLGLSWPFLGQSWGDLGASWGHLGAILGSSWSLKLSTFSALPVPMLRQVYVKW